MANTVMAKMAVQIAANTAEFSKALTKTSKDLTSFTGTIKNIAGTIGIAFGAQQVASFGLEIAKLSGQALAVETAFKRLPNSTALMNNLKEATGNTVSELELMKRAVQAANFDISLKSLPRLLEFATLRAQQTGQSVDYLVDSIVTGIGRKSKLILDNLGISAAQLSAEFKGASLEAQSVGQVADAVGRIAERNLKNMAGFSQNAATSMQQLAAAWEDLKVVIGDVINKSGLPKFVQELASTVKFFAGDFTLSKEQVEKTAIALNKLRNEAKELGNQQDVIKFTKMIAELTSKYGLLKDKSVEALDSNKKGLKSIDEILKSIQDRYDKLNSLARKEFEKPLEVRKLGSATGSLADPNFLKIVVENFKMLPQQMQPIFLEMQGLFSSMEEAALSVGNVMANAIEGAFSGALSGIQILRRATSEIVDLFARQAIAAAIANAAKAGSPFPFGAVIAATAAAAAMRGLLNRSGVKSSVGGGGGSGSFGGLSSNNVQSLNFSNGQRTPTIVLMATGAALKSVGDEQSRRDGRIRANARRLS